MLWELINTGHLARWWEWPVFVMLMLVLAAGPTSIWLIWVTRPGTGGHDEQR